MGDAGAVTDADGPYGALIETRLRVLTWNLWHRFGPWEARRPAIAATLGRPRRRRRLPPGGVGRRGGRASPRSWPAASASTTCTASRLDVDGVRFGNAVLSRWPITGSDVLAAARRRADTEELRTCVRADIDGPRGALQVFSTHLNWRFDQSDVRQEQVRAICAFIDASRPEGGRAYPPILCGDFNADPDSDEIRMLTGRAASPVPKLVFHDAWEVAGQASDSSADRRHVDQRQPLRQARPRARPPHRLRVRRLAQGRRRRPRHRAAPSRRLEPVDGVVPSDHLAVLAELRY